MKELTIINLVPKGPISYEAGLELQSDLHRKRVQGEIGDQIIFLEHEPVITMGTRGEFSDILVDDEYLKDLGVSIHKSNRGGQVTFHGPGQLVTYFIIDLKNKVRHVKAFVEGIEMSIIDWLEANFAIKALLENANPGIWVEAGKIAAIGISLKERVSMHGFALNISVPPEYFKLIIPCGIRDRLPVSLSQLVRQPPSLEEVSKSLIPFIKNRLHYEDHDERF